jgi:hypothetical protein
MSRRYTLDDLRHTPLGDVIAAWRAGSVDDRTYEEYRCLWRNSAPRFSNECKEHDGHDPAQCPRVTEMG